MSDTKVYEVGGVLFPRPFRIRRLGHFGYFLDRLTDGVEFYTDLLGLRLTEEVRISDMLPPGMAPPDGAEDERMFFTTYGSDHHALLLVPSALALIGPPPAPGMTTNQITWQVGSLAEVVEAVAFLEGEGVQVMRSGRDMPGSNWHVYFLDPDGFTVELFYGIEQIGWSRRSKPRAMYHRGFHETPTLPQMSENDEVADATAHEIDLDSGYRPAPDSDGAFDVGGVLLPRPFKVTKIGPVGLFVDDLDRSEDFYRRLLGFEVTEHVEVLGARSAFLRHGAEHHSLALYPIALRQALGLSAHTRVAHLGFEVGSYRQLRDALTWFEDHGCKRVPVPAEFHTGIDYAVHVQDPDGHLVQLYYYMEQLGWDGRPRPAELRRPVGPDLPDVVEALSDTYVDQTFQGPLG